MAGKQWRDEQTERLREKRKGMDQRSTATARGETTFIIFIQKTLAHMRNKAKQTLSELNKG